MCEGEAETMLNPVNSPPEIHELLVLPVEIVSEYG